MKKIGVLAVTYNLRFNPQTEVLHYHPAHQVYTSYPEKDAYCIQGRVIFLRKKFGFVQLLLEIRDNRHFLRKYGLRFCIKVYYSGMKVKFHKNNYDFKKFSEQGMQKYYAKTQAVTH